MRRLPAGTVFVAALALLCLLAVVDVRVATSSLREGARFSHSAVEDERVVLAETFVMRPGDRLAIHQEVPGASRRVFATYEVHVLDRAARDDWLAGERDERVHASVTGLQPSACCSGQLLVVDLPREAAPPEDLVDVVWVFHYRDGVARPADDEARRAFDTQVLHELAASPPMPLRSPVVFAEPAVRLRPALVGAMELTALVAAAAAALWAVQLRRPPAPTAAPGTEGLLRLHAVGGHFLVRLRDVLAGSILAGVLVVLHGLLAAERAKRLGYAEEVLERGWQRHVGDPMLVLYLVLFVVSPYAFWHVHRALAAWRRRAAEPPLGEP